MSVWKGARVFSHFTSWRFPYSTLPSLAFVVILSARHSSIFFQRHTCRQCMKRYFLTVPSMMQAETIWMCQLQLGSSAAWSLIRVTTTTSWRMATTSRTTTGLNTSSVESGISRHSCPCVASYCVNLQALSMTSPQASATTSDNVNAFFLAIYAWQLPFLKIKNSKWLSTIVFH